MRPAPSPAPPSVRNPVKARPEPDTAVLVPAGGVSVRPSTAVVIPVAGRAAPVELVPDGVVPDGLVAAAVVAAGAASVSPRTDVMVAGRAPEDAWLDEVWLDEVWLEEVDVCPADDAEPPSELGVVWVPLVDWPPPGEEAAGAAGQLIQKTLCLTSDPCDPETVAVSLTW